jgi:hypothetical protein
VAALITMPFPAITTACNPRSRRPGTGDQDDPIRVITMPIQVITMPWNG